MAVEPVEEQIGDLLPDMADLGRPRAAAPEARAPRRREPLFVHHLPREERFVGRDDELGLLRSLYDAGQIGMVSLVGIGGAGKSVLLDRFLRTIDDADGLLVWSFYVDEDAERFLVQAHRYLAGADAAPELRGRELADQVCTALKAAGRVVIVLDGLERAQQDDGRIAVGAIRDVVERLALGWGRALALVTTRLSLVDLQLYRGEIYREIRLGELRPRDAATLLARLGVRGAPPELADLAHRFGGHALTLSLVGVALARFFDGDPACVDEIVGHDALERLDQTGKLGRVLGYYERRLSPVELSVLAWMTALPRGATVDFLERFLVQGGAGVAEALRGLDYGALRTVLGRLLSLNLIQADTKGGLTEYGVHAAIKAHFYERMLASSLVQAHEAAYRVLSPPRTLAERPVHARPVEDEELNRADDVLFHAIHAGRVQEAYDLYRRLLGYEHLGAKLGAYALGERVVRRFFPAGDPAQPIRKLDADQRGFLLTELGLFLRQLGELGKAADCHALVAGMASPDGDLPVGALLHLAHDRLLQGSFQEVQRLADHALALAGKDRQIERCALLYLCAAHTCLGEMDRARLALERGRRFPEQDILLVSVRVDLNLRVGKADRANRVAREHRQRIATQSFREDHVFCDLLLAECALALGHVDEALKLMAGPEHFATRSSWRPTACRVHRLRARAALLRGDRRAAEESLDAAQDVAERYGLVSLLVDLLVLRGELSLESDSEASVRCAREARRLAENHAIKYKWGHADALDLWGRALARQGEVGLAQVVLAKSQRLREELGNAERTARTAQALAALRNADALRG